MKNKEEFEIHISVSFSWDLKVADDLEKQWRHVANTKLGGPAVGSIGGEFIAGRYLKHGYTITTRGCPNRCWFCDVWRREGDIRTLSIQDGYNILDSNILAAPKEHFEKVIEMLKRQRRKAEFTGGLEARLLTMDHAKLLYSIKPESLFFAYDTKSDRDYLFNAGEILKNAGFKRRNNDRPARALRSYVLIGFRGDSFDKATERLTDTIKAGFLPMAMLYRDAYGERDPEWTKFQRTWARPGIMSHLFKN